MKSNLYLYFWILALGFALGIWSHNATAQTPAPYPDVPLKQVGGVYPIGCHTPLDDDLDQVCWVRVDLPDGVEELGCLHGPTPDTAYRTDITVMTTPNIDATIKCYVSDTDSLLSDYSDNSGIIDFTAPGKPRIVWNHVRPWARTWPQSRERKLVLEVVGSEPALYTPRERQPDQRKTLVLTAVN